MDPRWYIRKPFGFSYFSKELVPIAHAWVETTGNVVFWRYNENVTAFVTSVWAILC